ADKLTVKNLNPQQTPFRIFNVTTSGAVNLSGMTMSDGTVSNDNGGGIQNFNAGTVNVTNCVLRGNGNGYRAVDGGGIYNTGGGIYNADFATANVTNSTLYFDTTDLENGGGIYNKGTLNVSNSTLDLNVAGNFTSQGTAGGGIYNDSQATGSATIKSTIIARSAANCNDQFPSCQSISDVAGSFTSQGFNLIGSRDGSTGFTTVTDITGTSSSPVDPQLDPSGLQINGGPLETVALLSGSPAIDKGTSNGLTGTLITDQRGVGYKRRIDKSSPNATGGDGADIGAFEFGAQIKAVS